MDQMIRAASKHFGPLLFVGSTFMTMMVTTSRSISLKSRSFSSFTRLYSAPVAKKVVETIFFGKTPLFPDQYRGPMPMDPPRTKLDSYNWLRDETRKDEAVLNHIKAENEYCDNEMSHLKPLQDELYKEMLSHLKETDEDMPYPYGDYLYYSKTIKGKSYRIHCRKPLNSDDGGEQIILDENIIAENQEYVDVSAIESSPDHKLLAYSVDYDGSETYTMTVKNILTGEVLPDIIEDISGDIIWGNDNTSLLYMKMDDEHRPNRLYMHVLGTKQEEDVCYLQEDDSRYWMGVEKSASDRFLFVGVSAFHYWFIVGP